MAQPSSAPPSRPAVGAAARDLSEAEFAELDRLLADIPEPLEPLDAFMLDGFLAAIAVHPERIDPERWLPYVFDAGGHRWGEAEPEPAQRRARELVLRRHAAIQSALAEFGSFEPTIAEPTAGDDGEAPADPVGEALAPWQAGFDAAADLFPGFESIADSGADEIVARLRGPRPGEAAEAAGAVPAACAPTIDAAIDALVEDVARLNELTEPIRYKVEPVRRTAPKVGRNDACPCGSGRKFKHCHGAG